MLKRLQGYVKEFEGDEQSVISYKAVQQTFNNYPKNADKLAVVLKVAVLNELYKTHMLATYQMGDHIHRLATGKNLDMMLQTGDPDAVEKIRKGHKIRTKKTKKELDFYSFATKYCHFSNPKRYPIYDQYVAQAVTDLRKSNYVKFDTQEDLKDLQKFKNVIDHIIQQFSLADYQQVDRALWVYGMDLAGEWY